MRENEKENTFKLIAAASIMLAEDHFKPPTDDHDKPQTTTENCCSRDTPPLLNHSSPLLNNSEEHCDSNDRVQIETKLCPNNNGLKNNCVLNNSPVNNNSSGLEIRW